MHFETNDFLDNTGVNHASNGGAVSLECDFVSIERSEEIGASDLMFSTWDNQIYVYDPIVSSNQFFVYKFATTFLNNTFTGNAVG